MSDKTPPFPTTSLAPTDASARDALRVQRCLFLGNALSPNADVYGAYGAIRWGTSSGRFFTGLSPASSTPTNQVYTLPPSLPTTSPSTLVCDANGDLSWSAHANHAEKPIQTFPPLVSSGQYNLAPAQLGNDIVYTQVHCDATGTYSGLFLQAGANLAAYVGEIGVGVYGNTDVAVGWGVGQTNPGLPDRIIGGATAPARASLSFRTPTNIDLTLLPFKLDNPAVLTRGKRYWIGVGATKRTALMQCNIVTNTNFDVTAHTTATINASTYSGGDMPLNSGGASNAPTAVDAAFYCLVS